MDGEMITASCLGRMGRWGNQVFQYMFVRSYARRYELQYQVNPWVGQILYGHEDPSITVQLPRYDERKSRVGGLKQQPDLNVAWSQSLPPDSREVIGHDFHGYAQFHTSYYRPEQEFLRGLFAPPEALYDRINPAAENLRQSPTVIGLHMRRGDTGRAIFYLTPNEWYLRWLKENWGRFLRPILFIASEDPSDAEVFRDYNPVTSADLLPLAADRYRLYNYLRCELADPTAANMDWFPDWHLLTQCDVLLFGESTFGFTAAMMAQGLRECWRSVLSKQAFIQIDPWDSYPLVREHLGDYPNVPGTFYTQNPKWRGGEVVP